MSKNNQVGTHRGLRDGAPLIVPSSNIGVDYALLTPQSATLKLVGETLAVAAADDYGSLELMTWQDRNILLLSVEVDLELVKGEVTNGLVAATDLDMGVGSVAASASTLATTMIDRLEKLDLNATDASPAYQAHSAGQSTATMPLEILDGATNKLFLNCAASITADDALTVSGTVIVHFVDLGNKTS